MAQAPTDLLPGHSLVPERACPGASFEDLRCDLLVDLGSGGEQVLEFVDLQRVAAGVLLRQTDASLALDASDPLEEMLRLVASRRASS